MVKTNVDNKILFIVLNISESITVPSNETWKVKVKYDFIEIGGFGAIPQGKNIFIPGGTLIKNPGNEKLLINGVVIND